MNIPAESVAIVERISAYSVALVNTSMVKVDDRSHAEKGIGTATAIRGRKRLFLLTARHNVEDTTISDLEFMPKPTAATIFGDSRRPLDRFNVVFRRHFPVTEIIRCSWEDLAILLIDEMFEEGQEPAKHMQFFQWREGITSPAVGSMIAALGHPVSRTYVVRDRREGNHIDREMGCSNT